jgi:hypothetical protein
MGDRPQGDHTKRVLAAAFVCSVFVHLGLLSGAGLAIRMLEALPVPQGKAALLVDFSRVSQHLAMADFPESAQEKSSAGGRPVSALRTDSASFEPDALTGNRGVEIRSIHHVGPNGRDAVFFPSTVLDRPPLPISAPNPRRFLSGTDIPPLPFRLRLYVDGTGEVVGVEAQLPIAMEESSIRPVKDMFLATLFVPGRLKGRDVPRYLDVEVQLDDLVRL